MDDLEFRTRAYSNPLDDQEDFRAAANSSPERRSLVAELTVLEEQLEHALIGSVPVPPGLRQKLHRHAKPASPLRNRRFIALAASLVVAAGLGLNLFLQPGPSAQDLALHDELIEHLYQEAPNYESADSNSENLNWEAIEAVIRQAGASIKSPDDIAAMHITFAKLCGLAGARGAHLVTMGEHGPVSFIFVKATPVSTGLELRDERFQGRIVPVTDGNMAVIGEKNESLEQYERLLRENLEWSI